MTNKTKVIISIVALAVAFGSGRYLTPSKIEIHTEIKEVIKTVEVEKESTNTHKNTQTHTIETTYPDGKKVIETYVLNQDTIYAEREKIVEVEKTTTKKEDIIRTSDKPQYNVGALAGIDTAGKMSYGAIGERRLFGNVFGGIYAKTTPEAGIVLSLEL